MKKEQALDAVEKAIDRAYDKGKGLSINSVDVSLFDEALKLMRDLAEHQNGAPLIRHEKEYYKTMTEVWGFLEANEV